MPDSNALAPAGHMQLQYVANRTIHRGGHTHRRAEIDNSTAEPG
jgi:hypothetical protein